MRVTRWQSKPDMQKTKCTCQILNTPVNKYSLLNGNEVLIECQTDGRTHRWPAGKHDIPH